MARKHINHDLHSPIVAPAITLSDTVDFPVTLRGVDVLIAGTLKVRTVNGQEATYTFTEFDPAQAGPYTTFPYRLELQIVRIYDTGSSLTASDLVPLR